MTATNHLLPRCTFPEPGTPVVCAWSGGPDSTALVVLARAAGCEVTAVHVDHGLRPDSGDDADHVRRLAQTLDVRLDVVTVVIGDGPNLEARAREARMAALGPDVLLGHTADDQAETVLLHLLRGAGPTGLGAMSPRRRPILELRRVETDSLCAALDLPVLDDPANHDPRFRRNRIRLEALPVLADIAERDPVPVLVRASRHQRDVAELLDDLAAEVDATDTRSLQQLHPVVAAHALRRWLRAGTGSAYSVDTATLDRVMAVVHHRRRATEVGAGWRVDRRDGRLR
ncbi:MAG: tRNA lysidine(34) synthetase TilS, partial [Acidimicrobiia bacterium]|nr:tRNA lysidine(34) synthetase TilS [Acidimicrobiia bacterium]